MNRNPLPAVLATALVGVLAIAGCKKHDQTTAGPTTGEPAATTPAPLPETPPPAPAPATALTVTTLDLGNAIGADNHIAMPMTSFGTKDTIHASVTTDGPGGNLSAKWTMGDKIVDTQDKAVAAGPQVTEFSISKPDGWPTGHYTLQVSANGSVLQSREFDVK
ncbi:hypothetical protein [Cognatiluteimonas telluris]|jgi:hypothetical protein|uniref:hypothetical protein n=1 Tax=Cognatiluteimonas telluris TaxID=1104775 RepID=UPI00140A0AFA|nr:hypothetical protein [Lysobacter telluris]